MDSAATETPKSTSPTSPPVSPPPSKAAPARKSGRTILIAIVLLGLAGGIVWFVSTRGTISTDDAYINGHVTTVAPRVAGQVAKVLVDDNNRVRKGDLLVQLDPEPYQKMVDIAAAAVKVAESDLVVAQAQARATVGQMRSLRFNLDHAMEDVDNQEALLRSRIASLQSARAAVGKAQSDYDRAVPLLNSKTMTQEEFDLRKEALQVAQAQVEEALQGVYQVRVSLGLSPKPESGDDLSQVPVDLDQTFSSVRQAQASLFQAAAAIGYTDSLSKSPREMVADFYKRDPSGDIDKIYAQLEKEAPGVKQSQAKLDQVKANLTQAQLNLRYCDVLSEIDGVVTRRDVNPGNNVQAGQGLMAVRSLTEIWVDANFKETQLREMRIGQPVDLDVDMYGGTQRFKGRVSGFTFGTGSTLALLPAENATGNFVKVVQRLPVRIELVDYDPDKTPLFIGLSVTARVQVREQATGPNAGAVLQPYQATPAETRP